MATEVNTGLWLLVVGFPSGDTQDWFQRGQTFGKMRWFNAHELAGRPGLKRAEIQRVYWQDAGAGLELHVVIHDLGPSPVDSTIAVFFAETVTP
jgi:hypothetical protein